MTTCHHGGPDDLPAFLCRRCHPEMNLGADKRAVLDAAEAKVRAERSAAEATERDLHRTRAKLESLVKNGEPAEGSVSGKIAASLRRKIERLAA